jgi:molybdate transport system regulatory protein
MTTTYPRPSLRIDFGPERRLGPGKIRLLEAVGETGSISAAARKLDMSYKRAWDLVDELNGLLHLPVVTTAKGGSGGGGAALTEFGAELIAAYRELEKASAQLVNRRLKRLNARRPSRRDQ